MAKSNEREVLVELHDWRSIQGMRGGNGIQCSGRIEDNAGNRSTVVQISDIQSIQQIIRNGTYCTVPVQLFSLSVTCRRGAPARFQLRYHRTYRI